MLKFWWDISINICIFFYLLRPLGMWVIVVLPIFSSVVAVFFLKFYHFCLYFFYFLLSIKINSSSKLFTVVPYFSGFQHILWVLGSPNTLSSSCVAEKLLDNFLIMYNFYCCFYFPLYLHIDHMFCILNIHWQDHPYVDWNLFWEKNGQ